MIICAAIIICIPLFVGLSLLSSDLCRLINILSEIKTLLEAQNKGK